MKTKLTSALPGILVGLVMGIVIATPIVIQMERSTRMNNDAIHSDYINNLCWMHYGRICIKTNDIHHLDYVAPRSEFDRETSSDMGD